MGARASANVTLTAGRSTRWWYWTPRTRAWKSTNLEDSAGSTVLPQGGANTGLGGTAPRPAPSPVLWVSLVAAGALIATAGAFRMRKVRSTARARPLNPQQEAR